MATKIDILPHYGTANRGRLLILLCKGGTRVLKKILLDLVLNFHLQNKKDQSQIGRTLSQQQYDTLYPDQGKTARLETLDDILLSIVAELLSITGTAGYQTTQILRQTIQSHLEGDGLARYIQSVKHKLETSGKLARKQWDILFPRVGSVNIHDMDITLLAFVLINTFDLQPTSRRWQQMPLDTETELGDDVLRLRLMRNLIFHGNRAEIDSQPFSDILTQMIILIDRHLGESFRTETEDLKVNSVDPELEKHCQDTVESWFMQDMELKEKLIETQEAMTMANQEIKKIMKTNMETTENLIMKTQQTYLLKANENFMKFDADMQIAKEISENACTLATDSKQSIEKISTLAEKSNKIAVQVDETTQESLKTLQKLQSTTEEMNMTLDTLTTKARSGPEPCILSTQENLKLPSDIMKKTVENWKERDKLFCDTTASQAIADVLENKNIVTIVGAPGSGKSMIAKHVALLLQEKDYNIYPLVDPIEVRQLYCENLKQVFFFDDPLGEHELDQDDLKKWKKCHEGMSSIIQNNRNVKMIVTIRSQLLNEPILKQSRTVVTEIKDSIKDITAGSLRLDEEERVRMFKMYSRQILPFNVYSCPFTCFPLLCHIYSKNDKVWHPHEPIFENPQSVLQTYFEEIKERNFEQFCGLLLCAVYGKVNADMFDSFLIDDSLVKEKSKITELLSKLGLDTASCHKLVRRGLDLLCGVYVQNAGGVYCFIHTVFKDIVLYIMGMQSTGFIFQYFPGSSLREIVRIGQQQEDTCESVSSSNVFELLLMVLAFHTSKSMQDSKYRIVLKDTEENWNMYIIRVARDITECRFKDVFNSPYIKRKNVENSVLSQLESEVTDVVNRDCDGKTVLHWSVSVGSMAITKCLLRLHADVNAVDKNKCSALFYANDYVTVKLLLEQGACVNLRDKNGNTVLVKNISEKKIVKLLLDKGADTNVHDKGHDPVLVMAARKNDMKMIKLLLDHNTEVNLRQEGGDTAISLSTYHNNARLVRLLLDHQANVNLYGSDPAIVNAAKHNNEKLVTLLLEHSADVNLHGISEEESPVLHPFPHVLPSFMEEGREFHITGIRRESDTYRQTAIVKAAYNNNTNMVKQLLLHGADANLNGTGPHSALLKAVSHNNNEMIRLLLHHGADVNFEHVDRRDTAIVKAAWHNNDEVVKLLVDHGADVNLRGLERDTAIVKAAGHNNLEMVKLLISRGAEVNLHGKYCDPAIVKAVHHKNIEMVQCLLEYDADCNLNAMFRDTAIGKASNQNNLEIVQLLIQHNADVNKRRMGRCSALVNAAHHNNTDMVLLLLQHGAKVEMDKQSVNINTIRSRNDPRFDQIFMNKVLYTLCKNVHVRCDARVENMRNKKEVNSAVFSIVNRNADVFVEDEVPDSALIQAAYNNNIAVVKLLLDHGSNVNSVFPKRDPAIVNAAFHNNTKMLKMLVKQNADVNLHAEGRECAIVKAALHNNKEMVNLLVANGADVNLHVKKRDPALVHAARNNNMQMVKTLLNHGATVNLHGQGRGTAVFKAVNNRNVEMVKYLLDHGAYVNERDESCDTILIKAVHHNHDLMVKMLIQHQADVNLTSAVTETPLDIATQRNNKNIVKLLLANGANVKRHGNSRDSALVRAVTNANNEIFDLLIESGANVNFKKWNGDTALVKAAHLNRNIMLQTLLENNAAVNDFGKCRDTALVTSVARSNMDVIGTLLYYGANVNLHCRCRDPSIVKAVYNNNIYLTTHLISCGAEVNLHGNGCEKSVYKGNCREARNILSLAKEFLKGIDSDSDTGLDTDQDSDSDFDLDESLDAEQDSDLDTEQDNDLNADFDDNRDAKQDIDLDTDLDDSLDAKQDHGLDAGIDENLDVEQDNDLYADIDNNLDAEQDYLDAKQDNDLDDDLDDNLDAEQHNNLDADLENNLYAQQDNDLDVDLNDNLNDDRDADQNLEHGDDYFLIDTTMKFMFYKTFFTAVVDQRLYLYPDLHLQNIGNSAIGEAVYHNNIDLVKLLLEHGASVNMYSGRYPPITQAVDYNNMDLIKLLLDHGADVNIHSDYTDTTLVRAVHHSNVDVVKLLIRHGADINICGVFVHPPLFRASSLNNSDMVEVLVKNGADTNYYDDSCATALSKAVYHSNLRVIQHLLQHDADVNLFGNYPDTALFRALTKASDEVINVLSEHGFDVS